MRAITKNQLKTIELVEGNNFYDRFQERASDALFDALYPEDVIEAVREATEGYSFESGKYNKKQMALVASCKGFVFGLGVKVIGGKLMVANFLNEEQVSYSRRRPDFKFFSL